MNPTEKGEISSINYIYSQMYKTTKQEIKEENCTPFSVCVHVWH